ncbi:MAG TPA: aspartate aminotransferase family protein, partial [Thermodesulfobacteriota bacterium]|nr:aspartate aminotransferase family protein [Thermodesulfobacteriota bacterium]
FNDSPVKNYEDARKSDLKRFSAYFTRMLKNGIFLPPSQFEAIFVSTAHTKKDIEKTLDAVDRSFKGL